MLIRRRVRKGFLKEVRLVHVFSMRKKEVCRLDAGTECSSAQPSEGQVLRSPGNSGAVVTEGRWQLQEKGRAFIPVTAGCMVSRCGCGTGRKVIWAL